MAATTSEIPNLFRQAVHAAVTQGIAPDSATPLGPYTLTAIRVIATEHPNSTADLIVSAYDAFLSEHR